MLFSLCLIRSTRLPSRDMRPAFTLIELLVVIAIIGVMMGLLLATVQKVKEAAARTECASNLKELAIGCHHYHDSHKFLPPARVARDAYATWPVLIMPYIEQEPAYNLWNIQLGMAQQSADALQVLIPVLFCPSRRAPMLDRPSQDRPGTNLPPTLPPGACGDYGCCAGDGTNKNTFTANGAMINAHVVDNYLPKQMDSVDQPNGNPPALPLIPIKQFSGYTSLLSITDGTSTTFMLGEKHVRFGHLGEEGDGDHCYYSGVRYDSAQRVAGPNYPLAQSLTDDDSDHQYMFGSWHPGVVNFAFCDGHVVGISVGIDLVNLRRLAVRNDGEALTGEFE
jgi:prepilin-type N-terminal cleavage/methylation domain-containing protein/prepilin-type processing-associated H-X9-DG protein